MLMCQGLNMMAVTPAHRHRGIGSLLMAWGAEIMQERNLEGFLEASELARPLYEKFGYRVVFKVMCYNPQPENQAWKRYAHDLTPNAWFAMWRPRPGGKADEGLADLWREVEGGAGRNG